MKIAARPRYLFGYTALVYFGAPPYYVDIMPLLVVFNTNRLAANDH